MSIKNKNGERIIIGMSEVHKAELERVEFQRKEDDNFFDWWENFTETAYGKNLEITEPKDFIRNVWCKIKLFTIEEAIEKFTR
jgi:hypothetical protein